MSPATKTQVKVLSTLVFEITGKRLSDDYRSKLLMRSQGDLTRLINQARDRITPPDRELDETVRAPSPREVRDARTPRGAWTRATLAEWGVPWPPPRGWRTWLRNRYEAELADSRPMALEEMR